MRDSVIAAANTVTLPRRVSNVIGPSQNIEECVKGGCGGWRRLLGAGAASRPGNC